MKNRILTFIIMGIISLYTLPFFAQTELRKQSVDSGGAIAENGTVKMLFTIGEVVVAESTVATYQVSEGFIGADINLALGIADYGELTGVRVFPNPVIDEVHIALPDDDYYELLLYTLAGKLIQQSNSDRQTEAVIRLQSSAPIGYLLLIKNTSNQKEEVFKLLTKN